MGKLKQSLPHGLNPDNRLFLAMFLVQLPPSMREVVMVKAANKLWDACGGHDAMVAVAMTNCSRTLVLVGGKTGDKRGRGGLSKSCPPSNQDFFSFQNPGNCVCKYHNYYNARAYKSVKPCAWSERAAEPEKACTRMARAMHFPANAGLIFLTV
jgi:hypothetical protein